MSKQEDPFNPKIGKKFELETKLIKEKTRALIAISLTIAALIALLASWIYSASRDDYDTLTIAVLVVSPPLVVILGWYFKRE